MIDSNVLTSKNPLSLLQLNRKQLNAKKINKDSASANKGSFKDSLKKAQVGVKNMDQINKTATDFEAFFVSSMLKPMFNGIGNDKDSMFSGGSAEKMWQSFLVDNMGKEIAKKGGFGLASSVKSELIAMQEHKS